MPDMQALATALKAAADRLSQQKVQAKAAVDAVNAKGLGKGAKADA